jgi:arylsulfatase A-like enzyme/Flp pilus assembly protein TadD
MKLPTFAKTPIIILVLVLVIIIVAAGWYLLGRSFWPEKVSNVVLVSIDTCRADFLGCYGYPLRTTPNIDAVARQAVLFGKAIAPAPLTLPSHTSMLTGTIPPYHRVLDNSEYRLGAEYTTLAEILKQNGFVTSAFISCLVLDSKYGLDQGFDTYDDDFEKPIDVTGIDEQKAGDTTRSVLTWLEEHQEGKNFIFVHYFDPHSTYAPPEPFASRFRNALPSDNAMPNFPPALVGWYAGEIAYVDHCIGQIIDKLKELDLYDSTLLIITSDHGEMLGEHGESTHCYFIYQSAVRVPLIFKLPGSTKPRRISDVVGLVDILPTVCSMLGIEPPAQIQGTDLKPYFNGDSQPYPNRYLYSQSLESTKYNANSLLGVVGDRYKYIQTTRRELYDLQNDPAELNNLAVEQPNRVRIMQDKLQQILEESVRPDTGAPETKVLLDEETLQRLATLGYVGGEVDEDFELDENKEDPKDLISFHNRCMDIGFFIVRKQFEAATEICRQLISERPSFYRSYLDLGKISLEQEDYAGAVDYLKKAIELKPDHVYSHMALGRAYKTLGQLDNAIDHYLKGIELRPGEEKAYYHLALCFYEQGRFDEADKHLRPTLFGNPSYVNAIVHLADKLLEMRQVKCGYDYYAEALRLRPDSVNILNSLAWIQAACNIEEIRNPPGAVELAQKACELDKYENPKVLDTLAVAYAASGAFDKAVTSAQKAVELAKSDDKEGLAKRIQGRLKLYKARQVYLDPMLSRGDAPAEL